ncbi:MAG: HEAT repeat domain-containing protein [Anaerolineales bacterium]
MPVLDELFSGDDARAEAALERVAAEHLPALEAALAGPDLDARWWALAGLARIGGQRAGELLLAAASNGDPDLRAAAIYGLGRQPAAIPLLIQTLGDPSEYLSRLAADALITLGAAAVAPLIEALAHSPLPRVRANASRALALIADTRAIPALFHALEDDSSLVQHWADQGLERMGVGQVYFKP